MGPVGIQDVSQLNPVDHKFVVPETVIIDDGTGTPDGVPLTPEVSEALIAAGLPTATPTRVQPTGNNTTPGTKSLIIGSKRTSLMPRAKRFCRLRKEWKAVCAAVLVARSGRYAAFSGRQPKPTRTRN